MNIFFLDRAPAKAAEYHCDKHVVKMILETAQLLSTAHRVLDGDRRADRAGMYRKTHVNHPCAKWVRSGARQYVWTWRLLFHLLDQYTLRYGKTHATHRLFRPLHAIPDRMPVLTEWTDPPMCMPERYWQMSPVCAYRAYYQGEKAGMAKWAHSEPPPWWQKDLTRA